MNLFVGRWFSNKWKISCSKKQISEACHNTIRVQETKQNSTWPQGQQSAILWPWIHEKVKADTVHRWLHYVVSLKGELTAFIHALILHAAACHQLCQFLRCKRNSQKSRHEVVLAVFISIFFWSPTFFLILSWTMLDNPQISRLRSLKMTRPIIGKCAAVQIFLGLWALSKHCTFSIMPGFLSEYFLGSSFSISWILAEFPPMWHLNFGRGLLPGGLVLLPGSSFFSQRLYWALAASSCSCCRVSPEDQQHTHYRVYALLFIQLIN